MVGSVATITCDA